MNDAEGAAEGAAACSGASEECVGSQFFDFSSARISRSIMSSGTRLPDFMAISASRPRIEREKYSVRGPGKGTGNWPYLVESGCGRFGGEDPLN